MSNKVLKSKKVAQFSIVIPDLSPVERAEFKFALKEPKENTQEVPIEKLKELAEKQGYQEGYKKGYEKGFQKGLSEGSKKGYEEGLKKGYEEGSKKAKKEYEDLKQNLVNTYQAKLEEVEKFLQSLSSEAKNLLINADKQVLSLAKKIAEKLVMKTVEVDEGLLTRIIKEALSYLAEGIEVKIKVNPEDYELLKEKISLISKHPEKITLISDKGITKGGVLIETSLGVIDATIEKRWEKVLKALEDED